MLPVINRSSNGVDVFPSIHVAVSSYLLAFDWRQHRSRARRLLLPCVLLWVSTIYLRYHYLIDVFAGFVLAAVGLAASRWYERSGQEREIEREAQRAAALAQGG
jgi:membrane-associated phospholipid phosphatase